MPPLSELLGSVSRKKLLHALERLGFIIDESGGKGSHIRVLWPQNNKSITIPFEALPKQVLKYILHEIEINTNGSVTWDELKSQL